MATPKRSKKSQPGARGAAPAQPESTSLTIRGFTRADLEALGRAVERRREAVGGAFVSQNTAILALLRSALAREDATGAIDTAARREAE